MWRPLCFRLRTSPGSVETAEDVERQTSLSRRYIPSGPQGFGRQDSVQLWSATARPSVRLSFITGGD
jgi:hypothetical protein